MKKSKYILWFNDDIVLDFDTDDEIIRYLKDNNIEYHIINSSKGKYISIANPRYFVIPGLLYFLQEKTYE